LLLDQELVGGGREEERASEAGSVPNMGKRGGGEVPAAACVQPSKLLHAVVEKGCEGAGGHQW
jgi:hypothetical protein